MNTITSINKSTNNEEPKKCISKEAFLEKYCFAESVTTKRVKNNNENKQIEINSLSILERFCYDLPDVATKIITGLLNLKELFTLRKVSKTLCYCATKFFIESDIRLNRKIKVADTLNLDFKFNKEFNKDPKLKLEVQQVGMIYYCCDAKRIQTLKYSGKKPDLPSASRR